MEPKGLSKRSHPGHAHRVGRRGEPRLPAAVAVLVAIALYALLPQSLLLGSRLLIPVFEAALLVAVLVIRPRRMTAETRLSRIVSLALAVIIAATNITALGLLVVQLVQNTDTPGGALLLGALQVWATNVIAFALIFWELDRGGPGSAYSARPRGPAAGRFPFQPRRGPRHRRRGREGLEQGRGLGTDVSGLSLRLHHELQCVQPYRHYAAE